VTALFLNLLDLFYFLINQFLYYRLLLNNYSILTEIYQNSGRKIKKKKKKMENKGRKIEIKKRNEK